MKKYELKASAGERVDVFVARSIGIARSAAKRMIESGLVSIDGRVATKPGEILRGGAVEVVAAEPKAVCAKAQDIPIDVIYEDGDIVAVNKPAGLVTHPCETAPDGTLENALLYRFEKLSGAGGDLRRGIVHRLDKDTSGVMVCAKTDAAHECIARQLRDRTMVREYLAIARGDIKEDFGTISAPIGRSRADRKKMAVSEDGREAITKFETLERFGDYTYVRFSLVTGRTHQIRVHAKHINHPIAGDPTYGAKGDEAKRLMLHAGRVRLEAPDGAKREFSVDPPEHFLDFLTKLRNRSNGRSESR